MHAIYLGGGAAIPGTTARTLEKPAQACYQVVYHGGATEAQAPGKNSVEWV